MKARIQTLYGGLRLRMWRRHFRREVARFGLIEPEWDTDATSDQPATDTDTADSPGV